LSFVVGFILVSTAVIFSDDLVIDDYYKEGKLLNNRFAAEKYARQQGIQGELALRPSQNRFEFNSALAIDRETHLVLHLSHPAEAELDQSYPLVRNSLKGYQADLKQLPAGRWYLRIEGFSDTKLVWRISGEADFSAKQSLILQ